jgi:hypothetical protein
MSMKNLLGGCLVLLVIPCLSLQAQTLTQMKSVENYTGPVFNTSDIKELQDWRLSVPLPKGTTIHYLEDMIMAYLPNGISLLIGSGILDLGPAPESSGLEIYLDSRLKLAQKNLKGHKLVDQPTDVTVQGVPAKEYSATQQADFPAGTRKRYCVVLVQGSRGYTFQSEGPPDQFETIKKTVRPMILGVKVGKQQPTQR